MKAMANSAKDYGGFISIRNRPYKCKSKCFSVASFQGLRRKGLHVAFPAEFAEIERRHPSSTQNTSPSQNPFANNLALDGKARKLSIGRSIAWKSLIVSLFSPNSPQRRFDLCTRHFAIISSQFKDIIFASVPGRIVVIHSLAIFKRNVLILLNINPNLHVMTAESKMAGKMRPISPFSKVIAIRTPLATERLQRHRWAYADKSRSSCKKFAVLKIYSTSDHIPVLTIRLAIRWCDTSTIPQKIRGLYQLSMSSMRTYPHESPPVDTQRN